MNNQASDSGSAEVESTAADEESPEERASSLRRIVEMRRAPAREIAARHDERAVARLLRRRVERVPVHDSFDPHGFFVYCLWSEDSRRPLYIGKSSNVLSRLGQHMRNPDIASRVRCLDLIRCAHEADCDRVELELIRAYQPELNVVGL